MLNIEIPQDDSELKLPSVGKSILNPKKVREWVDVFRNANPGQWPIAVSGDILDSEGNKTGETWKAIDHAFRTHGRSLVTHYKSLRHFLDGEFQDERIIRGNLTLEQIKEWVDVFRKANPGHWPTYKSGAVIDSNGKDTGETWSTLNDAFRRDKRGLVTDYKSLYDFLNGEFKDERIIKGDLTLEQIKEWVDVFRKANPGQWPTVRSGKVLDSNGKDTGETWTTVSNVLRDGMRGLNTDYKSLADFLNIEFKDERVIKSNLALEQIKEWVDVFRKANLGQWPTETSGKVLAKDGCDTGETWGAINQAFRGRRRGLKDCEYSSLYHFTVKAMGRSPLPESMIRKVNQKDDIRSLLRLLE